MSHTRNGMLVGAALAAACAAAPAARAADQPIDANRLLLRTAASGQQRLVLIARDRNIALEVPAAAGSTLELFSHATGEHAVLPFGPPEAGGWNAQSRGRRGPVLTFRVPGLRPKHRAVSTAAGVVKLAHRVDRHLELFGNATGLASDVAHTGIGVRLTVGETRLCALFDAPTVRRTRPGFFSAVRARASSLADCSDAALAGPTATITTTTVATTSTTSTSTTTSSTTTTVAGFLVGNPFEFVDSSTHNPEYLVGTRIDVPMGATVTHFGVIGKMTGPRVRLGLYHDQGGEPTTLVVGTGAVALDAGRVEIAVPPTPVAAGPYWLMAIYDQPASVGVDTTDPMIPVRFMGTAFDDGLPPFLFFTETFFGEQYNYYVQIMP